MAGWWRSTGDGHALLAANESILEEVMKEKTVKSYMSAAQRKAMAEERKHIPPDVRSGL